MAEHQAPPKEFTKITYFGACIPKFSLPTADENIETEPFTQAARQILPFLEKLGAAFTFVKSDVLGNIEKIEKHYSKDPHKYVYVKAILEEDTGRKMSDGCIGLLWLMRGLVFVHRLFLELIEDHKNGVTGDDMGPPIRRAYNDTLKAYHGWLMQKTISGVTRIVPSKSSFLKRLVLDDSATVDDVLNDIQLYDVNMWGLLQLMEKQLEYYGKNSDEKA